VLVVAVVVAGAGLADGVLTQTVNSPTMLREVGLRFHLRTTPAIQVVPRRSFSTLEEHRENP